MGRRIRLCELTPHLGNGGIETRVSRVLGGLPRDEFELTWLGLDHVDPSHHTLAGEGVRVVALAKDRHKVDLGLVLRLARLLREIGPDVVRVHNWSTSFYGIAAARLAEVPHVVYESAGRESPEGPTPKRRLAMRGLAPMVDTFLAVCPFLAREMEEEWGLAPGRVRPMPTGVDLSRFSRADRAKARASFQLPDDAFVVGTIGMLRTVKRIEDIVEAGVRLLADEPRAHLLVIGSKYDGSVPEAYLARAREAGVAARVHLPGRVIGAEGAIAAFDVFINASSFEGASNAIIEAMAASVPVIATAAGGNVDVVIEGRTGHLVPVGRPDLIHARLAELSRDPARVARLGAESRRVAEERHSLEGMCAEYRALFRAIARSA